MGNMFFLFLGIAALTGLQFFECWAYLLVSKKIQEPKAIKGQVIMGVAWLIMAILICATGVLGINLISYIEIPINRALGILPVALGFAISIFAFKDDWKVFYKRFQEKR